MRTLAVLLLLTSVATAHDWYEKSCCAERDCHPVDDDTVHETDRGVEIKGYGILSYSDPRLRWSRDNKDHICESSVQNKLICVYRRPKGV